MTCLLVGALLTAINQGDRLVRGEFSATIALQIGLTFLVPFVVATMSGAAALRGHVGREHATADDPASDANRESD